MTVIDRVELDLLRSETSSEWFESFLEQCLCQIEKHIADLNGQDPALELRADSVHSMIGSAGVIGACKVQATARSLEAALAAGKSPENKELIAQLIFAWVEASEALKLLRADRSFLGYN